MYPLFAAIGFASGAMIIGFAHSREANHPGAAGAVGGVVNMGPIGFAAILQPLLGSILDGHWDGLLVNGARIYDADAYSAAFLWLFLMFRPVRGGGGLHPGDRLPHPGVRRKITIVGEGHP